MVIAVDGPGGVGKSTVARGVADRLGLPELNTGAFYRAATLAVLRADADLDDPDEVVAAVQAADIDYTDGHVTLGGEDVAAEIRSRAVTAAVSRVSAEPGVRALLVAQQQAWVARHGGRAVVEGRDIGTVVFPNAALKVYLTARHEVRAARRAGDRESAGQNVDRIAADLDARDRYDSSREVSPLRAAPDAVTIDTSDLGIDEVLDRVEELARVARRSAAPHRPLPD